MLYYNVQAKIDEVFFLRCLENEGKVHPWLPSYYGFKGT